MDDDLKPLDHYYGDVTRILFLIAGVVLLFAIVRDREFLTLYMIVGVFSVLALTILAGLTSPRTQNPLMRKVIVADFAVSVLMFLLFEYLAISAYIKVHTLTDEIFFMRQCLALIFIIAVYFSTKTVRGMFF